MSQYEQYHHASGTVEGTGSAITISCGGRPTFVELYNIDGDAKLTWEKNMGDGKGQKMVDSGTGATDISTISTGGVTPAEKSFSIGTDSDINASGETIIWRASW